MEDDVVIEKLPNMDLALWKYQLTLPDDALSTTKAQLKARLMDAITANNMVPFYQSCVEDLKWPEDRLLIEKMKTANDEKLKQLDAAIKDAQDNLGESEVRDALQHKADFFARIGDKTSAVKQYQLTEEKTVGAGQKLDITLTQIRLGLFWMDHGLVASNTERARLYVEQGSDWDRKNRLRVYEAVYSMSVRQFKRAALLFLESISTFAAVELLDYTQYIFYTVLMAAVALDRATIRAKVLNAPEVLAVIDTLPHVGSLINSLYYANYKPFFAALAGVTDALRQDRFMGGHAGVYCKEMRILAYSQLLESYKSVELGQMAAAFGVSAEFLDAELARFISVGRLHGKVDKVGGVVETNRPDSKNAQYITTIKQADLLLNRIQKLSRVINL